MADTPNKEPSPMGARIRAAREAASLSREQVARLLFDLDVASDVEMRCGPDAWLRSLGRSVFRWESRTTPSVERLAQIAGALDVSMHWLATGEHETAPATRSHEAA